MPIGVFARCTGLTASALRFYADSGLLPPAEVDPGSGYRYYGADQVERATALRGLRELAMPLTAVEAVLGAGAGDAARLIDEHVAKVLGDAEAVREKAASVKSSLTHEPSVPVAVLRGPVLADAIEQVLTAAVREPGMPVLGALRVEATTEAVTLTATDRYRLATRTLVPVEAAAASWAATVDGDELRAAAGEIRRSAAVRIEATPHACLLRTADRGDLHCRLLADEYPDHRSMLAALPGPTTRAAVSKDLLLRVLEDRLGERITLRITRDGLTVPAAEVDRTGATGAPLPAATTLTATTTGRDLEISFEPTTLYPAVSTAVGPDVLLDLRGPGRPVTIRSADRGDLTTLVMPVAPDHPA
ncbi:DNA polymerase III subunit beta family protein [Streptomyces mayonensis]|uniref:DNA polymerase III subunit beta family protein n=1 Tax=Streptomyces mayonensis TaxID=2750816 RepID=UPI001C1E4365|nr:MerR family transcriptional regulator [Streptomyces sp. A108]MBU6533608.1 MerR family transcriptional regulator [Streptomyces sp. A108]